MVVSHQTLSPIKGCLPSNDIFHQRSSSIKGCLPSKVNSFGLSQIYYIWNIWWRSQLQRRCHPVTEALPVFLQMWKNKNHLNYFKGKNQNCSYLNRTISATSWSFSFVAKLTTFGMYFGLKNLFPSQNCAFENGIIIVKIFGQCKVPPMKNL